MGGSKAKEIGETVKEYLTLYPTEKSKTIARMIHKECPHLGDIEHIRGRIRYYRAAAGDNHRMRLATDEFINQPYKITPKTDEQLINEVIQSNKLKRG
jgi:hypothetical protein